MSRPGGSDPGFDRETERVGEMGRRLSELGPEFVDDLPGYPDDETETAAADP